MDIEYIFLLAFNPLFLMFTAFCICLICGVGGAALAGFNTGASDTTAKKECKYILRRAGILLLIAVVIAQIMTILFAFEIKVWAFVMLGLLVVWIIITLILMNTKKIRNLAKIVEDSKIDTKYSNENDNQEDLKEDEM